jgi:hypothetical protein
MGDQDSRVFSTGTYGFMISYNDVGEGGFTLPDRVFFFVTLYQEFVVLFMSCQYLQ